jgi:ubiquinone/menaquinone biosynthesis C-methylase UbiE
MNTQKNEWEESYRNRDNFVFYPHEEVIRFVSKYIRKRIGFGEFRDILSCNPPSRILDLGCGIGRHVVYCHDMGLDAYGVDLSEYAVGIACSWARNSGMKEPESKIVQGDVRNLPWGQDYFDFVLSHGVLDSMHFAVARSACQELSRVLKKGGLCYCDLISGDDSTHAREFAGEETVVTLHEKGTIQSYFNFTKISQLIEGYFEIMECLLIQREDTLAGSATTRYHLILKGK